MKHINFMSRNVDIIVKELLIICWSSGFSYEEVMEMVNDKGYHIPEDQWLAFNAVLDIQTDLHIGTRVKELENE